MNVEQLLELRRETVERAQSANRLVESLDDFARRICPTWDLRLSQEGNPLTPALSPKGAREERAEVSKRLTAGMVRRAKVARKAADVPRELRRPRNRRAGTGMTGWVQEWLEKNPGKEFVIGFLKGEAQKAFPSQSEEQISAGVSNGLYQARVHGLAEKLGAGMWKAAVKRGGQSAGEAVGGGEAQPTKRSGTRGARPSVDEAEGLSETERKYREFRNGITAPAKNGEEA